ncbi:MAG: ParB family protein [Candidatus Accumulibacter sp.]|jgi:ParB family protein of integrating conjugative element (PFGI_1 class)|nr:ParB family protein [Accumulibacter sp.]
MPEITPLTPQEMAGKLLASGFAPGGPPAAALSDPIADTPIVVTLDELAPYELNPRLTKNPLYGDIKASIRERGLDAPPPITRRPGAEHYIIRNGGNTRLAILRELWSETKEERFFRISCLFRPWPERGEIVALTGHLAENELHGGLTFIERALGVEKARELYEQESGQPLSQSELARRLSADGYPIQQSYISRMQDTVCYLLPAIPNVLYGGLGRHQVERLAVLRKTAELAWERRVPDKRLDVEFETLFHDVLAGFDTSPEEFSFPRVQDELIGQMAGVLGVDYTTLELDLDDIEQFQRAIARPPQDPDESPAARPMDSLLALLQREIPPSEPGEDERFLPLPRTPATEEKEMAETRPRAPSPADPSSIPTPAPFASDEPPAVPPAADAERLQAIQQLVTEHMGGDRRDFVDGLFPVTDLWHIEPSLDAPEPLRLHIAQFAREIAEEAQWADGVAPVNTGIGFVCTLPSPDGSLSGFSRGVLALLRALSRDEDRDAGTPEGFRLDEALGPALRGRLGHAGEGPDNHRLSDDGLVKLFRLLRLARRLRDLESGAEDGPVSSIPGE